MRDIIKAHYGNLEEKLLAAAITAFYELREMQSISKKPSTSELLDWLQALRLGGIAPEKIAEELPFAGVLLKKTEDLEALNYKKNRSRNFLGW